MVLSIVRALFIATTQFVWLTAYVGRTCADEFPVPGLPPAGQAAGQWPSGNPSSAQPGAPAANQNVSPPPAAAEKLSDETAPRPVSSIDPVDADARPRLDAFWDYGLVLESSDKAFRFHIGGLLEFDNTWYQQSQSLPFLLQDGSDMRRARLRADGSMGETVDFITEVNFANIQDVTNEDTTTNVGSVGLDDFYVGFKKVPVVENVVIGHFKQPIGLEHSTGASNQYYMERSDGHDAFFQPFEFVTGIKVLNSYWDDRMTTGLSLARVGKQTVSPFAFGSGPGEYGICGRLTCLPVYQDDGRYLMHLGIGYYYTGTDNNNFYAANRPLVRAGAGSQDIPNILYTGTFYTPNAVQLMNGEFAAVAGRFSMSAEYQLVHGTDLFQQDNNGVFSGPRGNVTYQGFYAEAGFFLNADDYRRYDKKDAAWGRQVTLGGSSADKAYSPWLFGGHTPVQLLCRYSYLDLDSGNPVLTPSSARKPGGSTTSPPVSIGTSTRKSILS